MPRDFLPVPFALAASVNLRAWAGLQIFSRGAAHISLPSWSIGEGLYEDPLAFLHSYGSQGGASAQDLSTRLLLGWTAAGAGASMEAGLIEETDHLYIEADAAFSVSNGLAYGFTGSTAAVETLPGTWRAEAPADWRRGLIDGDTLTITPDAAPAFFTPPQAQRIQSVITLLRKVGSLLDADDLHAESLEHWDNEFADDSLRRIRWGLGADGRVWSTWPSAVDDLVWDDLSFAKRWGFSGNEEIQISAGGARLLLADHPMPGLLCPSRPYSLCDPNVEEQGEAERLTEGFTSFHIGTWQGWLLNFHLDGPMDAQGDLVTHFLRRWLPYAPRGSRVALYRDWGDPRRCIEELDKDLAYSLLHTSQDGAGRLRCYMSPRNRAQIQVKWPRDLRMKLPVQMILAEATN